MALIISSPWIRPTQIQPVSGYRCWWVSYVIVLQTFKDEDNMKLQTCSDITANLETLYLSKDILTISSLMNLTSSGSPRYMLHKDPFKIAKHPINWIILKVKGTTMYNHGNLFQLIWPHRLIKQIRKRHRSHLHGILDSFMGSRCRKKLIDCNFLVFIFLV